MDSECSGGTDHASFCTATEGVCYRNLLEYGLFFIRNVDLGRVRSSFVQIRNLHTIPVLVVDVQPASASILVVMGSACLCDMSCKNVKVLGTETGDCGSCVGASMVERRRLMYA